MRLLGILILIILLSATVVFAVPLPTIPAVNHKTRQCALITPGDECGIVILPADWEYLDETAGESCPSDYTIIKLFPEWDRYKAHHCCTEGHSGVAGDCQDVVIHQSSQQCAFIEDIHTCSGLPKGWEAWGKDCPQGFEWVDDISCMPTESYPTSTIPLSIVSTATQPGITSISGGLISTLEPTKTTGKSNNLLPCSSTALI